MNDIEFELNSFLISVAPNGEISIFTNNTLEQKKGRAMRRYLEGKDGNNVTLLLEESDIAIELIKVFKRMKENRLGRVYGFPSTLEEGAVNTIRDKGCVTLFTTNGNLQYDSGGRAFADRSNFNIIKIERVKILH